MLALSTLFLALPVAVPTQDVLPLRERAALRDAWLEERLDTLVPELMRAEEVDVWIVLAREYNEDPVIETMLPATWMAARRRTILVFHDPGAPRPVERFAVARYDIGKLFASAWNKEEQPDQWVRLGELVASFEPRRIALNVDPTFALGDGLSHSQHAELVTALGAHADKVVTGLELPIRWLETRTRAELAVYPSIVALAHRLIREGFSADVVVPGETTTADVEWWFRERMLDLRVGTWFHPSVSLQRGNSEEHAGSFATKPGVEIIQRGDLLHVDIGITYLGLNTDTQQHAYVLREGEESAPQDLERALAVGNRLQDLLMAEFVTGRTGNEILSRTLRAAGEAGIAATVYTHPLGYHGHGAGPTIGLWDQQGGVPGRGDYPLFPSTAHSIELSADVPVPAWGGKTVRVMLEEDAIFDGEACRFLDGRQVALILIP